MYDKGDLSMSLNIETIREKLDAAEHYLRIRANCTDNILTSYDKALMQDISTFLSTLADMVCNGEIGYISRDNQSDGEKVSDKFEVGDKAFYGSPKTKTLAVIEIVEVKDTETATIKFLNVIEDETGNNYFKYLLKTNGTMVASFKYMRKIPDNIIIKEVE